jgi:hypothetical protein
MVRHEMKGASHKMSVVQERAQRIAKLFPGGIPRLWCPTLTHFRAARGLWMNLASASIFSVSRRMQEGSGSRIDGRGLADERPGHPATAERGLENDSCQRDPGVDRGAEIHCGAVLSCMDQTLRWLESEMDAGSASEALVRSGVVGFTVCPPRGQHLSQAEIRDSLTQVLERGLPVALYQLPQVTGNEMSPETVSDLAARFPNLLLLKDTSGQDRVALSDCDLGGLFLVRGAEGGYCRWTRAGGGPYDGLLLSTANVFAPQFDQMLQLLDTGRSQQARELAKRIEDGRAADFRSGIGLLSRQPVHQRQQGTRLLDDLRLGRQGPRAAAAVRRHEIARRVHRAREDILRAAGLFPESPAAG